MPHAIFVPLVSKQQTFVSSVTSFFSFSIYYQINHFPSQNKNLKPSDTFFEAETE